jgi:hypothetical protein
MDAMEGQRWMDDCQRLVAEFNDVAIPAFRQEWGDGEGLSVITMELRTTKNDIQLIVGSRAAFFVEGATGLIYKIGSDGRVRYEKCIGHITGVTGREAYQWLWW